MSWHCIYCGNSDKVTGLIELYDTRGGIPIRICCHLKCFSKTIKEASDIKTEIIQLDKENKENDYY